MLGSIKKHFRQLSNMYTIISDAPMISKKFSPAKRAVAVVVACAAVVCVPQLIPSQPAPSDAHALNLAEIASFIPSGSQPATLQRVTGADMPSCTQFQVCGTDLGIPYRLENGSVGYLFGDTFTSAQPGGPGWRSNVMLRSTTVPSPSTRIVFDSAAGIAGNGYAPEIVASAHDTSGRGEWTNIPTDGISFPETGDQIISYMSVRTWDSHRADWETNHSGIAWSNDGNTFHHMGPIWANNGANNDPNQMMSMQRGDDGFVYIVSVRAGRQHTPVNLQRVPWDQMFNKDLYECWDGYGWGTNCEALFSGMIGEPSLRRLSDGTWAIAYLNLQKGAIVTRHASQPNGPWSAEKVQITGVELPNLYGGFIHPDSTPNNLTLMVSTWTNNRYDVNQLSGLTLAGGRSIPAVR